MPNTKFITINGTHSIASFRLDTIEQVHACKGFMVMGCEDLQQPHVRVVTTGEKETCVLMASYEDACWEAAHILGRLDPLPEADAA